MKKINISTLRKSIKTYFEYVSKSKEVIIVKKNKQEMVVLMPVQEYNSLKETEYLLSSDKNRMRLLESIKQMKGK